MRTPGIFIFGMVLAPCGWILNLTATVAPNWRTINTIALLPVDTFLQQGIWDICKTSSSSQVNQCNQKDEAYFNNQIIAVAQGLMVASLILTLIGLATATPGVRCWKDRPNWTVAGLGGMLIFLSGVLTIIPIAWYTHIFKDIAASSTDILYPIFLCRSSQVLSGWIGSVSAHLFPGLSRDVPSGSSRSSGWATQGHSETCPEATPTLSCLCA
uniref:Claudin 23.2 n=1 Tax=Oncorhynchus kisutch TaxID=8019 RepID=A0A8C7KR75_ONCKI